MHLAKLFMIVAPLVILTGSGIALFFVSKKDKTLAVKIVSGVLILCAIGGFFGVLVPVIKPYITPTEFLTEPAIFDAYESYSIMWATSVNTSGEVELLFTDGTTKTFADAEDGVGVFSTQIHKAPIPKDLLATEGVKYRVKSKRTKNVFGYEYYLGKEIVSEYYTPQLSDTTTEEVSFLTISDIQFADKYAREAIAKVSQPYDFVVMMGDYANYYNYPKDIIEPLLDMAARASKSTLPCIYLPGNHEQKGSIRTEINRLFKTPSRDNNRYYTWSYNNLHATVLDMGDDHDDDNPLYSGGSHMIEYRNQELDWLKGVVDDSPSYESYTYNVAFMHNPIINDNELLARDYVCTDCNKTHPLMYDEFQAELERMDIDMLISAHTHRPKLATSTKCAFPNLQTGANIGSYGNPVGFSTMHVKFYENKMCYTLISTAADDLVNTYVLFDD